MKRRQDAPTLKTIAEMTGVTPNTVSLALRGSPLVAEETRRAIAEAAREVGYVRNDVAGSMRSGHTYTIAILFGDIGNMLFAIKIAELERALRRRGYQVLILNTSEDADMEYDAVVTAISKRVDGIILCPCQADRRAIDLIRQRGIPYVLIGRRFESISEDAVLWDDYAGGRIATEHLIRQGCRRILMLNVPLRISSAHERQMGYEAAMLQAGLACQVRQVSPLTVDVMDVMNDLCIGGPGIDGLFAFSDLIAFSAAQWCQQKGIRIPEDMLMVGFDDILSHVHIPFSLSSVSADKSREAETVAELLLSRIEHSETDVPAQVVRMDVSLVARHSTNRGAPLQDAAGEIS